MIKRHYELVIVGGGIIGLITALVSKINQPNLSIAIIEQNRLGAGASTYSAGLNVPLSKGPITSELIRKTKPIITNIQNHFNLKLIYKPCIHLLNEENILSYKNNYLGHSLKEVSSSQFTESIFPGLKIPKHKHCLISQEEDVHFVYIQKLIDQLSYFLKQQKVSIYEGIPVTEIETFNHTAILKCMDALTISTDHLVLATGPWLLSKIKHPFIEPETNVTTYIKKIVAFHLNHQPTDLNPIIMMHEDDAFLLPLKTRSEWLFSISSKKKLQEPKINLKISKDDIEIAKSILNRYHLDFSKLFCGGRVFCDSYTAHKEPYIQKITPNIIKLSGASGSGYRLSYGIAQKIFELLDLNKI